MLPCCHNCDITSNFEGKFNFPFKFSENFLSKRMSSHGQQELTDPVEEMLKKTGCMELHYKVQECIAETKDWRKCQNQVTEFKKCMLQHQERKLKGQA